MNFVKVDAEGLKKFDIKNKKIYSVTPIQNGGEIFKWVDFVIVFEDENKSSEPILDDAERKYLSGVIRPFRDRVVGIYKYNSVLSNYEEIAIDTCADYNCNHMTHLPPFKIGLMYKNMELNKEYTLDDLNL